MKKRERLPYEENEQQIESLERTINASVERRDYAEAEIQQAKLNILLQDRAFYQKHKTHTNNNKQLRELNEKQKQEEEDLKRRMSEKMDKILREADAKLKAMKQKHQDEINALDKKYSDPRFGNLRISPEVQALLRAENYYVKNKDFKMARAVKNQVTNRARYELGIEQSLCDHTIQSTMDKTISQQQLEMKIFHDNLETQKNKLKRETSIGLQMIYNKYSKIRHDILGSHENDNGVVKMIPTDGSVTGVYKALDSGFSTIQDTLVAPSPPPGQRPTTSSSPRSPRSQRSQSPSSTRRSNTNQPTQPLTARNGCTSPRNPRVARAFENSLKRTGFVKTN